MLNYEGAVAVAEKELANAEELPDGDSLVLLLQHTIERTNDRTRLATGIMGEIWRLGLARGPGAGGNPFDEAVEKKWVGSWLFRANTIRFASAMAGGGDYGVFAGGRFQQSEDIQELSDWLQLHRRLAAPKK